MEREVARQFFISRIVDEAAYEGTPLSPLETKYLDYDLLDDAEADPFEAQFEETHDSDDFLNRVPALLLRALKREVQANPGARGEYKQAWDTLKASGTDQSLVSFVDGALASDIWLRPPFSWFKR